MNLTSGKRIIRNKWTILPIPAKVIATIHQLAVACKKYKGIVFMDKDGNIINDDSNDDYDNTLEITGVETTNNDTLEITGVSDNTPDNTLEITGVSDNMENTETATETEVNNNKRSIAPNRQQTK